MTYIKLSTESVGDAGDQYTGLDRFGRIVDQRWINSSNTDVDRYQFGYDRDGNRLYKDNKVIASLSEVYTYDSLNQLASYKLGTLNGTKTDVTGTPATSQSWDYDAVGNWDSVTTNSTTQTRTANKQNEITAVSGATTPTYDSNGNLTTDENNYRFVYDAWNKVVQVKNSSNVAIVTYGRDALHRHVTDTVGSTVTDRFFSGDWQLLETKVSSNTVTRNVWSPVYVDGMVLRDRDTDGNGSLDERLYALQDANWNTTALVNAGGTVQERYTYAPFGQATFRDGSGSTLSASAKDWVFLHQGGERVAAGDYEFRNRVYSPNLGRWLSNDPLGFNAGDQNWYRAIGNNPGNGLDPSGFVVIFIHGRPGFSKPADINVENPNVGELYRYETKFGKIKHFAYLDSEKSEKYIIEKVGQPGPGNQKEPIIIIGHSYGGNSAIQISNSLIKKGYEINLLATLDPYLGPKPIGNKRTISPKIKTAWNWRQDFEFPNGGILVGPTTKEYLNQTYERPDPDNPGKTIIAKPGHRLMDDTPPIANQIKEKIKDIEENFLKVK
jgi:RHS repeat-associated protein